MTSCSTADVPLSLIDMSCLFCRIISGEIPAKNVIVLLEVGNVGSNWRAGILNHDLQAQVKKDVADVVKEYPQKLLVIGAASDGEMTHASRVLGDGRGQSVFSHFAVQGLLGDANGWQYQQIGRAHV